MKVLAVLAASFLLAVPAWAAASGRVIDPEGKPIPGASVCIYKGGVRSECVTTDDDGRYTFPQPELPNLVIEAKGFKGTTVPAENLKDPIRLIRPATLLVKVVDAVSGQPISKGTVSLSLPSGKKVGSPVPFNRAGVRMSTLTPGETMVRAEAEGYEPGGPLVVDLVGGEEKSLVVPMKKSGSR